MATKLGIGNDHVAGGFLWEQVPSCRCGLLAKAIEDKVIFVSNMVEDGFNRCYMFLLTDQGELHRGDGTPISHCPWCGAQIRGLKKTSVSEHP